jgi:hypothetical protein
MKIIQNVVGRSLGEVSMKRLVMTIVMVTSLAGGSSFAADGKDSEKDWCLLGESSKCEGTTTFDLLSKIKRVNVAIEKGTSVYTPEEIEHFNRLLEELNYTHDMLFRNGSF